MKSLAPLFKPQCYEIIAHFFVSPQFAKIFQSLQRFVVSDLSNFYLDIAKDR
jgi:isoleucyl-tRNA synthetase